MGKLIKCPSCGGTKKIMGMGMMQKECKNCHGVGWIEKEEEGSKNGSVDTGESEAVDVRKKRGRKPKKI